jgi:uncharacterized damage-inducible protein DinB
MDPRYPVGKFTIPGAITSELRASACAEIAGLPRKLRMAANALSEKQLETPYRDGGWTARQVIHHVADSHMNSYIRFRLALTEDIPTIKPYDEARWAELSDAKSAPIEVSLQLIDGLHDRWSRLLQSMTPADFARTFRHPELGERTLDNTVQLYAWHGRHHLGHLAIVAGR